MKKGTCEFCREKTLIFEVGIGLGMSGRDYPLCLRCLKDRTALDLLCYPIYPEILAGVRQSFPHIFSLGQNFHFPQEFLFQALEKNIRGPGLCLAAERKPYSPSAVRP